MLWLQVLARFQGSEGALATVQDGTGSCTLTLYDSAQRQILGGEPKALNRVRGS